MKPLYQVAAFTLVALVGLTTVGTAWADHPHRYRPAPRANVSISVGVPVYRPHVWPRPYLYYHHPAPWVAYPPVVLMQPAPRIVLTPPAPPVYIEQPQPLAQAPQPPAPPPPAAAPQPTPNEWYYCVPARAYYPYASECTEPWQRVPALPAGR